MARALSADFPVELRAEHSEVVPAGRVVDYVRTCSGHRATNRYILAQDSHVFGHAVFLTQSAIYAVHGKTKAESSLLFNDQHPLVVADHRVEPIPEGCVFFDPTSLTATKRPIPPRQGLMVSRALSFAVRATVPPQELTPDPTVHAFTAKLEHRDDQPVPTPPSVRLRKPTPCHPRQGTVLVDGRAGPAA